MRIANFHHQSTDCKRGFTLLELLVTVSIIGIIAVVGITLFLNVQKGARDSRRKADIDTVAKVFEINKTGSEYQNVAGNQFASGAIPQDPKGPYAGPNTPAGCGNPGATDGYGNKCWYCIQNPAVQSGAGLCSQQSDALGTFNNYAKTSWRVCANLENSPLYYCRLNQQ